MKRLVTAVVVLFACAGPFASCTCCKGLSGDWNLVISNYRNSCGGEPTAADQFSLKQKGTKLTAVIAVAGEGGQMHEGTFHGELAAKTFPTTGTLQGEFSVGTITTKETIEIDVSDERHFTGHARWESQSDDGKIACIGSQDIAGTKK